MTKYIPQNFLALTVSTVPFDSGIIRAKYPKEISEKLLSIEQEITSKSANKSAAFAINVEHHFYITKNKNEADATIGIDNSAQGKVQIIKEMKDPNLTHNFTAKRCCTEITKRLNRNGIDVTVNMWQFSLFCIYFGIKNNEQFCFTNTIHTQPTYSYSIKAIDFITEEYLKDPNNIITKMKESTKKR
jgi:hypothetical protein